MRFVKGRRVCCMSAVLIFINPLVVPSLHPKYSSLKTALSITSCTSFALSSRALNTVAAPISVPSNCAHFFGRRKRKARNPKGGAAFFGTKRLVPAGDKKIKHRLLSVAEQQRFYHFHIQLFFYRRTVLHRDCFVCVHTLEGDMQLHKRGVHLFPEAPSRILRACLFVYR